MRIAKHKLVAEDIDDLLEVSGIKAKESSNRSRSSIKLQDNQASNGSLMGEDMELPEEPTVTKPR